MSGMEDCIAEAILLAFEKQAEDEDGTTQHVEEMLDGTVCLDGCFDLKEIARAAIAAMRPA